MNYNGAGVLDFVLLGIDHIEEVEDTAWVCGYAVVRPGQEVELVHTPGLLPLCTKMPETLKYSKLTSERMTFIHTLTFSISHGKRNHVQLTMHVLINKPHYNMID